MIYLRLLLISLGWLALMGTAQAAKFVLTGQIAHPQAGTVSVSYRLSPVQPEPVKLEAQLDEEGRFELGFSLNEPRLITFGHGEYSLPFFLFPEENLDLIMDAENPEASLEIPGKNISVRHSRFLQSWQQQYETQEAQEASMDLLREAPSLTEAFFAMREAQTVQEQAWQQAREEGNFSREFVRFFEQRLLYEQANQLIEAEAYFNYYHEGQGLAEDALVYPSEYDDLLASIPLEQPEALDVAAYFHHVDFRVNLELFGRFFNEPEDPIEDKFAFIQSLDPSVQTALMAYQIKEVLSYGDPSRVEERFQQLPYMESGDFYHDLLLSTYEKAMRITSGQAAPLFKLRDAQGNEFSLKQLRGKVVYLDFWASWCGPCRAEAPYTRQLMETYMDREDIAFVFISVDQDEAAWHKAMDEENLPGIHLMANEEVASDYNINAIPQYFLIDQEGRIADPFAPRPSSGKVGEKLEQLTAGKGRR